MKISRRCIARSQFDARRYSLCCAAPGRKGVYESPPKFRKAFKSWLRQARHRLGIPLTIRQISTGTISLSFDHYPAELAVRVSCGEISVAVLRDGRCIDFLISIDCVVPVHARAADGKHVIVCRCCTDERKTQYATLNQFWVEHLFEEFAHWVNSKLAPAACLSMHEVGSGGSTWARLHKDMPQHHESTLSILNLPQQVEAHIAFQN